MMYGEMMAPIRPAEDVMTMPMFLTSRKHVDAAVPTGDTDLSGGGQRLQHHRVF